MASRIVDLVSLLVLYQIVQITCLPLMEETGMVQIRVRRLPANNFQFGFGSITPFAAKNPIASLQGSINHFANILKPKPRPYEQSNIVRAPINQPNERIDGSKVNNDKNNNPNFNDNTHVLPPNVDTFNEGIKRDQITDNKNNNVLENKPNTLQTTTFDVTKSSSENKGENITEVNINSVPKKGPGKKLDQQLLDYIFLSDTESTTTEYTTTYGDYETVSKIITTNIRFVNAPRFKKNQR